MVDSRSDIVRLFSTRIARMFAYGFVSVALALYLADIGLTDAQIGLLFSLTLVGDAVISLGLTTTADRVGRRRMLVIGAALMVLGGAVFALTKNPILLMAAAIVGVISPSGNEIGPFLSIEQASLSQLIPGGRRTRIFAWYNLVGSFATALGSLSGGALASALVKSGSTALESYRVLLTGYALVGVALALVFTSLSARVELPTAQGGASRPGVARSFGLHKSRGVVFRLSGLFALDAFGGGFVVQSIMAYWFHVKFGVDVGTLGRIFFGANVLAGISGLLAARIAGRIGLIRTMVFTHLPSNVLLVLVPFMPSLHLAIAVLLVRFSISQMDVPTRQSYTMAVVAPDERSAASGVTTIARSVGASISPSLTGVLLSHPLLLGAPFVLSGGLKIIYDLLLYRNFKALRPPEEAEQGRGAPGMA
jgi:MFS family permease